MVYRMVSIYEADKQNIQMGIMDDRITLIGTVY